MSYRIQCALFALVLGWAYSLTAQETVAPKPNPPPAADEPSASQSAVDILGDSSVLKELQLNEEQRQKVRNLIQEARSDVQEIYSKIGSQPQGEINPSQLRARAERVFQDYRRKIEDILTPSQARRLRELEIRVRGMKAVLDPEIAAELKLTEMQTAKIQAMIADSRIARHNMILATRRQGRFGRQERRAQLKQLRADLDQAIRGTLSAEQVKQFENYQGPAFDAEAVKAATPSVDLGEAEG
ncbi:MAG TPA: hypothetical protein VHB77_07640, partial [Planctomycetaceae bacterium]|nr:hypothetical protein [Planctomycetaceae bacterium]